MSRMFLLCLCLLLVFAGPATPESKSTARNPAAGEAAAKEPAVKAPAAKELSGMSIVGNDEAPKSLYIVPWKRSELGAETSLNKMLNERAVPVDRDEFMRQLEFYAVSTRK